MSTRNVHGGADEEKSSQYGQWHEKSDRPVQFKYFSTQKIKDTIDLYSKMYQIPPEKISYGFAAIVEEDETVNWDFIRIIFSRYIDATEDTEARIKEISSHRIPIDAAQRDMLKKKLANIITDKTGAPIPQAPPPVQQQNPVPQTIAQRRQARTKQK